MFVVLAYDAAGALVVLGPFHTEEKAEHWAMRKVRGEYRIRQIEQPTQYRES